MVKKRWLVAVILLLVLPTVTALRTCQAPTSQIKGSVSFCGVNYYPKYGITIEKDDILIDCANAVLQGTIHQGKFVGTGISVIGRHNVTLKNCKVALYETGVLVKDSSEITLIDSSLIRNKIGIKIINSQLNFFEHNQDISIEYPVEVINSTKNVFSYTNKKITGDFCRENLCNDEAGIAALNQEQDEKRIEKSSLRRALNNSIRKFLGIVGLALQ